MKSGYSNINESDDTVAVGRVRLASDGSGGGKITLVAPGQRLPSPPTVPNGGDLSTQEYDKLVALVALAYVEADRRLGRALSPEDDYKRQAETFVAGMRAYAFHLQHSD